MRDTIYRDDAIRVASGYCHPANVAKELAKLPSAQPERTGKWIYEPAYDWHRCGACKKVYPNVLMEHFNECQYQPRFNYCPNCGARMEVEHERNN